MFLSKICQNVFSNLDQLCPHFCWQNGVLKEYAIALNKCTQHFASDSSKVMQSKFDSTEKFAQMFSKFFNFCNLEVILIQSLTFLTVFSWTAQFSFAYILVIYHLPNFKLDRSLAYKQ